MTVRTAGVVKRRLPAVITALAVSLLLPTILQGQATISTGNINGTVIDPSGAAVSGAKITITDLDTDVTTNMTTNSSGFYNSGSVTPGKCLVKVEAKGFETAEEQVTVKIANNTAVNFSLKIGQESTTVSVDASAVTVNTETTSVEGVLTASQIDNLPVNGRNFLDLAQLEPGVQIQDGTNFDPTKIGYQSVSIGSRFGRTARIQVDGIDISDETVGTTTGNISASAIQEFQITQSTMDISNGLSSSGVVNVSTKSGTNTIHGSGYEYYRSSNVDASLPKPAGQPDPNYHRNQYGGTLGGAFVKDKLFYFAEGDATYQNLFTPVVYAPPFQNFGGGYNSPYKNPNFLGRLDYVALHNVKLFFRYNYSQIQADGTFFSDSLQVYQSKNYSRNYVGGADFTTGSWTHSFRFGYLKFQNEIVDATIGSGLPLSDFPGNGQHVNIFVVNGPQTGPNLLAPQSTLQSNKQISYDGGKTMGRHILRYGVDFNHIQGGNFAKAFALAPQIITNQNEFRGINDMAFAATGPFPGGASNPLNFPVETVILGNGQGFSTTQPAFGFPAGGLGPDNRLGLYIADTWKMFPNFTVNLGLRYDRDTGRTDSDLPAQTYLNNLIPTWPNLGAPIPNPNLNFGPSLGIAWDPWKNGKTAIRAGIGLYYENVIWNNVLFDRPLRLPTGAFLQTPTACNAGQAFSLPGLNLIGGQDQCGTPGSPVRIGDAASALAQLQAEYQALSPFSLTNPNPNYLQTGFLDRGVNFPLGLFASDYKTPRSTQINVGIQRELTPGVVLSVDYVRNVTTALLLSVDQNHTGDVRHFYKNSALAAISATTSQFGCGGGTTPAAINCAIAAGATISHFAQNGLDSQGDLGGTCTTGCAFGGENPNAPAMPFLVPAGISLGHRQRLHQSLQIIMLRRSQIGVTSRLQPKQPRKSCMRPLELVALDRLMARSRGRSQVIIGLIDGPVSMDHPDFSGAQIREVPGQHSASCSLASSVACMHGTFVAGMLCARRGSSAPAICPDCTLLVRPIFTETPAANAQMPSATPEELATAITDVIGAGANVINLSAALTQPSSRGEYQLEQALDYAAQRGVLVVAAAGNQGTVGSSAITRHPWVIPVVACDLQGRPTAESNLGSSIGRWGLAAPGQDIISLGAGDKPQTSGGTSAAAPFVTGAIALLWSEFLIATAAQIKLAVTHAGRPPRRTIAPPLLDAWAAYEAMSRN